MTTRPSTGPFLNRQLALDEDGKLWFAPLSDLVDGWVTFGQYISDQTIKLAFFAIKNTDLGDPSVAFTEGQPLAWISQFIPDGFKFLLAAQSDVSQNGIWTKSGTGLIDQLDILNFDHAYRPIFVASVLDGEGGHPEEGAVWFTVTTSDGVTFTITPMGDYLGIKDLREIVAAIPGTDLTDVNNAITALQGDVSAIDDTLATQSGALSDQASDISANTAAIAGKGSMWVVDCPIIDYGGNIDPSMTGEDIDTADGAGYSGPGFVFVVRPANGTLAGFWYLTPVDNSDPENPVLTPPRRPVGEDVMTGAGNTWAQIMANSSAPLFVESAGAGSLSYCFTRVHLQDSEGLANLWDDGANLFAVPQGVVDGQTAPRTADKVVYYGVDGGSFMLTDWNNHVVHVVALPGHGCTVRNAVDAAVATLTGGESAIFFCNGERGWYRLTPQLLSLIYGITDNGTDPTAAVPGAPENSRFLYISNDNHSLDGTYTILEGVAIMDVPQPNVGDTVLCTAFTDAQLGDMQLVTYQKIIDDGDPRWAPVTGPAAQTWDAYLPDDEANWPGTVPTSRSQALDLLAARVKLLEP